VLLGYRAELYGMASRLTGNHGWHTVVAGHTRIILLSLISDIDMYISLFSCTLSLDLMSRIHSSPSNITYRPGAKTMLGFVVCSGIQLT